MEANRVEKPEGKCAKDGEGGFVLSAEPGIISVSGGEANLTILGSFSVLVSQTVITPYKKTSEGWLIKAATFSLRAIIERIIKDPSLMYEVDPRKWEEIIAATYDASGLFDVVTLTPRSGDRGRDVIAEKMGFGSVRLIESVKRHAPGTKTTAEEVQALLGVLLSDPQASKGIVSTTWEFAPMIWDNPYITQFIPHRLELIDGNGLVKRLKEYTTPKSK